MGLKALKDIELQSHIEAATLGLEREADLVTTNSIRGGKNRAVLDAIAKTTRIYEAWSDEGWVNNGAAVRVSLVSFGHAAQPAVLNGQPAEIIHADLSAGNADGTLVDLTTARRLAENVETCFEGIKKYGAFDVSGKTARMWLRSGGNPNQLPNFDVLHPWINATDVVRHNSDNWVIDFTGLAEDTASLYEKPFEFARLIVLPERAKDRNKKTCEQWWLYERSRTEMRNATTELSRFIVTPVVDWHRIFAWRQPPTLAMNLLDVVARADDTTFGILHSPHHELWSLRMGNSLEDRPSYTPTTCFETFPFPAGLGPVDTAHQRTEEIDGGALISAEISAPNKARAKKARTQAVTESIAIREYATHIACAAKRLNDLREHWLNPPEWTQRLPEVIPLGMEKSPYPDRIVPKNGHEKKLAERTLTKLYNQRPAWLDAAHQALDAAVAAAYGWLDYRADMPNEEILKRLLALNLQRAKAQGATK